MILMCFKVLLFSGSVISDSLHAHGLQHTSFLVLHHLLELAQTHFHWVGDAIQPSCPLSPFLLLPSIFLSIKIFSNESGLHIRWPKYWSFSISSSNEHSELISFRIETGLMSLQSKGLSRVLSSFTIWKHQFFGAQHSLLSNSHMRIWLLEKTKALTIWTFVSKVMSAF